MADPENESLEMIEDMRNRVEMEGNTFGARKLVMSGVWWKKGKGVIIRPVS